MNKTISYRDHSISYRDTGKGRPIVLLHGLAEDGEIWKQQEAFLDDRYRLIIPDLPGSGSSELTDDVSMEAMADSVKAILDAEAIEETIMIGHSMGGYVTLAFAEKYGGMLKAFGLFHSTAYADSEERKAARKKSIEFIQAHGTLEYLKQATPGLFGDDYKKANAEVVYDIIQQYKTFNPLSIVAYLQAMMQRPDRTAVLKEFVKPVLFIIGKQDNAIPFDDSMKQCHLPTLSYIHILENAGHMGMVEEVEKSNSILETFLRDAK